jgi:hypothetical protein
MLVTSIAAAEAPHNGTFVPCSEVIGLQTYKGRQVALFSEGTAWMNEKWVWLTVFNPTVSVQRVWVRVFIDGRAQAEWWTADIGAKQRMAWNMNEEIRVRTGLVGRVNFATEVDFSTLGAANIAVWSWDYMAVPVYLLAITHCQVWTN